jgi:hypothetical protein
VGLVVWGRLLAELTVSGSRPQFCIPGKSGSETKFMYLHRWYFYDGKNDQICSAESQGLLTVRRNVLNNDINPFPRTLGEAAILFPYGEDYKGEQND